MEHVIESLLTDFERGRMTRRQLIQSLALAAVAAEAAKASTIPPPHDPAPWKTVWLDHVSYAVSDYRRSTAFYRDLMGWEIRNDNGNNQCTLKIGDIGEIIIRNGRQPAAAAQPAPPQPGQPARPPLTGVINHVSYGVQPWDTEGVKAELEKRGLRPRPD